MIPCALLLLALLSASLQAQEVCLLFSGEERGYLEPCGCARPALGGIAKRHTFLKSLSGQWLSVSLGDLVGGDTLAVGHVRRQDELKAETLIQALKIMDHSIHNLGEMDLDMGLEVLTYLFPPGPVTLLSSNIRLTSPFIEVAPYEIHKVVLGEKILRVGFLGILSPTLLRPQPAGIEVIPPAEALPPLIRELKDMADVLVLLSHADMEESLGLARDFPEFHLIASGHGADCPIVVKEGNTWVFTPGIKGKHLVLYRYDTAKGSGVVEAITLDERFEDSAPMLSLLDNYQERLREEGLLLRVEKFPIYSKTGYAGSHRCSPCHPAVYRHWESTPHGRAYETLQRVGRAFDPECVVCHVVGLNSITGFQSQEITPGHAGVGCEVCHGPSSMHVSLASTSTADWPYFVKMGTFKATPETCKQCHDPEHGPPFQFESYWERIRHPAETPISTAVVR